MDDISTMSKEQLDAKLAEYAWQDLNQVAKDELSGKIKPVADQEPEQPQEEVKETASEQPQKKDKFEQKQKINWAQTKYWKEKAEKAEAEKAELLKKINSGEIENDLNTTEQIIDKIVQKRLAEVQWEQSFQTEEKKFIKNHPTEIEYLDDIKELAKEHSLDLDTARIVYLSRVAPEKMYDPAEENRKKIQRMDTSWVSEYKEDKKPEDMTSDELANLGKELLKKGKIDRKF